MKINQNSHSAHPEVDSSILVPFPLFFTPASPAVSVAVLSVIEILRVTTVDQAEVPLDSP